MFQELDEYIVSCKNRLRNILSALDWTEEDTLKERTCSRRSPREQSDDKDDPLLPESFDCKHSIVIGEDQLKAILKTNNVSIPKKFSDIQLNFTREQKRELYDYVIYNTGKISEPELKVSISNDNQSGNDMTFAEIVAKAKKKDNKLKRKYRTSKPTHIEEVRNVVHLQMQALAQYFNTKSITPERGGNLSHGEIEKTQRRNRRRESVRSSYLRKSRSKGKRNRSNEGRSRKRDVNRKDLSVDRISEVKSEEIRKRSRSGNERKRSRNKDGGRSSKDRSRSRNMKIKRQRSRSSTTHNRLTHSRSPAGPSKEKQKSFSKKKNKKRRRSHSKHNHKSSKKHKHKELKMKKEFKEE